MRAGETSCSCPQCGVVCEGRYNGCPEVWARGPQPVALVDVDLTTVATEVATRMATDVAERSPANGDSGTTTPIRWPDLPSPVPEAAESNGKALADVRADLRLLVERMTAQQATLADWRAAIEAELSHAVSLSTLPERLAETGDALNARHQEVQRSLKGILEASQIRHEEMVLAMRTTIEAMVGSNHDLVHGARSVVETINARNEELARRVEAAIAAVRAAMQEERDANVRVVETALREVMRPFADQWAETSGKVGKLSAQLESFPQALTSAFSEATDEHWREVLGRVEGLVEENRRALATLDPAGLRRFLDDAQRVAELEASVSRQNEEAAQARAGAEAEMRALVERMGRRLVAAEKARASGAKVDAVEERVADAIEKQLQEVRKLARAVQRKAGGTGRASP